VRFVTNEITCPKCGTLNPSEADFCQNCGKKFGIEYASLGQRIGACLLDLIIIVIGIFIIIWIVSYLIVSLGFYLSSSETYWVGVVIGFLVEFGYFIFLEAASKGQTLGKMALSIRVVDKDTGEGIGWGQSLIRNLLRIIDFLFAGLIGIILIASSDENQRLGDKAANTIVIKE